MTTINSLTDATPAARAVDVSELPIPPYRGNTLPSIDYERIQPMAAGSPGRRSASGFTR